MNYIPTGNMAVSLPCIREKDAAIENITFLHMGSKGMIDVRGSETDPLLRPYVTVGGVELPMTGFNWTRLFHFIPSFSAHGDNIKIEGIILAPMDERGFGLRMCITNSGSEELDACLGLSFCWAQTLHSTNEDKPIDGVKHCYPSNWNGAYVFDMRCGLPLFALAPMCVEPCEIELMEEAGDGAIRCRITRGGLLSAGESLTMTCFFGLGYEEVAAATSAKEMLRQGWEHEFGQTAKWLQERTWPISDERLSALYHQNLFFCIFFALGLTLDTEELVSVTSRSSRYYVSAAYWDRDSLLWAFPAILDVDTELARQMLLYVFGRQQKNIGVHSRYIDGTVLEPGFELDELMAPLIALERYVEKTGERGILERAEVLEGVESILHKLGKRRHPDIPLFSTFLQPTDDEIVHPYITYNNVLVWYGLRAMDRLYPGRHELLDTAEDVKNAIWAHCVQEIKGQRRFAWSLDLEGHFDVYDEPPGSLLLLPYYGFCTADDPVHAATVAHIRSADYAYSFAGAPIAEIGCPHAPHPWILSIANSLLCGHAEAAIKHLLRAKMDNGIACESVDAQTGQMMTGAAFATCAGFLCHAIRVACTEFAPTNDPRGQKR